MQIFTFKTKNQLTLDQINSKKNKTGNFAQQNSKQK